MEQTHWLHTPLTLLIVQADLLECGVQIFSVFCNASGALLLKFPSKSNSNNQAKGSQWFSNSYCKQHSLQTDSENHGLKLLHLNCKMPETVSWRKRIWLETLVCLTHRVHSQQRRPSTKPPRLSQTSPPFFRAWNTHINEVETSNHEL